MSECYYQLPFPDEELRNNTKLIAAINGETLKDFILNAIRDRSKEVQKRTGVNLDEIKKQRKS